MSDRTLVEQMDELREALKASQAENAKYRARLEIDFATNGKGDRVPFPFVSGRVDGIACRDETIRLQDKRIAELKAENVAAYNEGLEHAATRFETEAGSEFFGFLIADELRSLKK